MCLGSLPCACICLCALVSGYVCLSLFALVLFANVCSHVLASACISLHMLTCACMCLHLVASDSICSRLLVSACICSHWLAVACVCMYLFTFDCICLYMLTFELQLLAFANVCVYVHARLDLQSFASILHICLHLLAFACIHVRCGVSACTCLHLLFAIAYVARICLHLLTFLRIISLVCLHLLATACIHAHWLALAPTCMYLIVFAYICLHYFHFLVSARIC